MTTIGNAARTSALLKPIRQGQFLWRAAGPASRRLAIGTALVCAAVTQLGLAFLRRPAPGWLWAVIPFTAVIAGLLLVASARPATEDDR